MGGFLLAGTTGIMLELEEVETIELAILIREIIIIMIMIDTSHKIKKYYKVNIIIN